MASKLYVTSRLKELRESNNMSQQEFVQMMGVWLDKPLSLSMVQKMEQGKRPINPELLLEIAKYFKVEPKELVERR
jgi:transcriptional regulator with XRE-family HTH domain